MQTARLKKPKKIILDNNLNEKNYGIAEGMNYRTLSKKFSYIKQAWNKKKDPRFPKGESDKDVYLRNVNLKKQRSNF